MTAMLKHFLKLYAVNKKIKYMKTTSIKLYLVVNKSGFVGLHNEEPIRDKITGKWISNKPFINSAVQKKFEDLVKKTGMNWESEPEFFEITI